MCIEDHQIRSNKYNVHGMKEVWCLSFQRSKELRFKAALHFNCYRCFRTFVQGRTVVNVTFTILNTLEVIHPDCCYPDASMHSGPPQHSFSMYDVVCRLWSRSLQPSTCCGIKLDTFLSNTWIINTTGKALLFNYASILVFDSFALCHLRNVSLGLWRSPERPPSFDPLSHITVERKSSCR